MEAVFLKLVNLSLTASVLALVVMLARIVLRKAPKWIFCVMWGMVALRLVLPFSIESPLSLMPSAEPLLVERLLSEESPQIQSGTPYVDSLVNPVLSETAPTASDADLHAMLRLPVALSWIWLGGMLLMLGYAAVSTALLRRRLRTATLFEKGIKQSEAVGSPFVLGIIRPVIYLPYHIDGEDLANVIAHEKTHISRKDHWWKPLGFLLLSVYWFNPVLWLAYVLLCRDIEAACDEKVVQNMDRDALRAYSTALLRCGVHRRRIAACPLAFGENGVKGRVKNVMNYKKPAFWIVAASVAVCVFVSVCFLTDPAAKALTKWSIDEVDMTSVMSDLRSMSVAYGDNSVVCSPSEMNRFAATMEKVKVRRTPVTQSRAEDRAKSFTMVINERLKLYFNEDFSEIWVDNDVKPSFSYPIANPETARELMLDFRFSTLSLTVNQLYGVVEVTYLDSQAAQLEAKKDTPEYMLDDKNHLIADYFNGPHSIDLGRVSELALTEENFDEIFADDNGSGWRMDQPSASEIRKNTVKAWSVIYNRYDFYYILMQENGDTYIASGFYDYYEKDEPDSDDTCIQYLFKLAPQEKSLRGGKEEIEYTDEWFKDASWVMANEYAGENGISINVRDVKVFRYTDGTSVDVVYLEDGGERSVQISFSRDEDGFWEIVPGGAVNEIERNRMAVGVSDELLNETPEVIVEYARDYVAQLVDAWNSGSADAPAPGRIVKARITGLEPMDTGVAGLTFAVYMYRLEYRLLPEDPENIILSDGMQMEEANGLQWITEWGSRGQPFIVMSRELGMSHKLDLWTCLGVTDTLTI